MSARDDLHRTLLGIKAVAISGGLDPDAVVNLVNEALDYLKSIPTGDLNSDQLWQIMLEWRNDISPHNACSDCSGSGYKTYANTATYHHGSIAGQALTSDVCDGCWGSGDKTNPWPSRLR